MTSFIYCNIYLISHVAISRHRVFIFKLYHYGSFAFLRQVSVNFHRGVCAWNNNRQYYCRNRHHKCRRFDCYNILFISRFIYFLLLLRTKSTLQLILYFQYRPWHLRFYHCISSIIYLPRDIVDVIINYHQWWRDISVNKATYRNFIPCFAGIVVVYSNDSSFPWALLPLVLSSFEHAVKEDNHFISPCKWYSSETAANFILAYLRHGLIMYCSDI